MPLANPLLFRLQPALKCLFMSGHSEEMLARQGILDAGVPFIQKPFTLKGLSSRLQEVLGEAGSRGTAGKRRAGE